MSPHYQIIEQEEGRWVITSVRDKSLLWCGSHWGYVDQHNQPLISFPTALAAAAYARKILGEANER